VPRLRHLRHVALTLLLVAGCVPETSSVVAHPSYCGRWVGDATANHTRIKVAGRDLSKNPYDFLIKPTHQTDLSQPVYVAALAYDDAGQLLGEASFDAHPFSHGQVLRRRARISLFGAASQPDGPKYVTSDGCVCVPGQPWVGTGSGTTCDRQVVTSFARLGDTAGCELTPKGAPLPVPACDGQLFGDETNQRALPCFAADAAGACRVTTRSCDDQFGVAYGSECTTDDGNPALPSATLCAQYRKCQQDPCGNLIGCFEAAFPARRNVACTLHVDPTTKPGDKIQPCSGGTWKAELPGGATTSPCLATLIEGVAQPPFTIGLVAAMQMGAQALSTDCPTTLQVDALEALYPMALPTSKAFDLVVGEELVHVTVTIELSCPSGGVASLVCTAA
jgi:hypothetical protein